MNILTKKFSIAAIVLMTTAVASAHEVAVVVNNNSGHSGSYLMKIGDGITKGVLLKASETGSFNYDFHLTSSANDIAVYTFTTDDNKTCEVFQPHEASKILENHYTKLLVDLGDLKHECAIKLQYS